MQPGKNNDNFGQDSRDSQDNEPKTYYRNEDSNNVFNYNFHDDETREASADDYMDSDRENYNRNNDRFRWSEPEEE